LLPFQTRNATFQVSSVTFLVWNEALLVGMLAWWERPRWQHRPWWPSARSSPGAAVLHGKDPSRAGKGGSDTNEPIAK